MKRVFVSLMGIGILAMTVVLGHATNEQESAATLWSAATLPAPIQKMAGTYSQPMPAARRNIVERALRRRRS